ncbi:MAG: acyl transferase [Bacteroidota bacterium]
MENWDVKRFREKVYEPDRDFEALAQELWTYQRQHNPLVEAFASRLDATGPVSLPIRFFKEFSLQSGDSWEPRQIFTSSGTTGQLPSRHLVKDPAAYRENVLRGFHHFFPKKKYKVLALLPSYLERDSSSLVQMVRYWMEEFGLPGSGFYLYNFEALNQALGEAMDAGEDILLIGVAFALLDFAEQFPSQLPPDTLVMETGGMKGRKEELVRTALHQRLKAGLGVSRIVSEYGMTEMMSQAYTMEHGRFLPAPSLKIWISDLHLDRLRLPFGHTGRLHFVDLANIDSCAFVATDDLGRLYEDGSFEVMGRIDAAELRGCNLMYI